METFDLSGGTELNREKMKGLVLYVAKRAHEVSGRHPTVAEIGMFLYLCDITAFKVLGRSITGSVYTAEEVGPQPKDFRELICDLLLAGDIRLADLPKRKRPTKRTQVKVQA